MPCSAAGFQVPAFKGLLTHLIQLACLELTKVLTLSNLTESVSHYNCGMESHYSCNGGTDFDYPATRPPPYRGVSVSSVSSDHPVCTAPRTSNSALNGSAVKQKICSDSASEDDVICFDLDDFEVHFLLPEPVPQQLLSIGTPQVGEEVGHGAFSTVHVALHRPSSRKVVTHRVLRRTLKCGAATDALHLQLALKILRPVAEFQPDGNGAHGRGGPDGGGSATAADDTYEDVLASLQREIRHAVRIREF